MRASLRAGLSSSLTPGIEASEPHFSVLGGAGAIVSTATDLTKFIQAVFDLKLVSADSLKLMTTMRDGEGMGLVTFSFAGKTLYGNTGGSASTGAWLNYFRKGATLFFQAGNEGTGVALEATAENKFKTGPVLVFEFDVEKGEMIVDRGGRKIVFKKQVQ